MGVFDFSSTELNDLHPAEILQDQINSKGQSRVNALAIVLLAFFSNPFSKVLEYH
jgi:hypothetical protein